jgi:hypothetical protein
MAKESSLSEHLDAVRLALEAPPAPPELLFHYTDAAGLLGIIQDSEIWATHVGFLNDTTELEAGERVVDEVADELQGEGHSDPLGRFFARFASHHIDLSLSKVAPVYVTSFSENGDLLSQWRAYGGGGSGFAIGLQQAHVMGTSNSNEQVAVTLLRCQYDRAAFRETVKQTLRTLAEECVRFGTSDSTPPNEIDRQVVQSMLIAVAKLVPQFKHSGFEEEAEWRMVVWPPPKARLEPVAFRNQRGRLVPYIRVKLGSGFVGKVIVGPSQIDQEKIKATKMLLQKHGYTEDLVVPSDVPFRG